MIFDLIVEKCESNKGCKNFRKVVNSIFILEKYRKIGQFFLSFDHFSKIRLMIECCKILIYMIKQDIPINVPYSWPNDWTEWAEIFCGLEIKV